MDGTGVALISFVVIIVIIFVIGMCMGNWNGNGRRRRKRRKTREKFTAANVMQRLLAGSEDGDLTRKVRVPGAAGMELEGLFGVVQITTEGPPELITEVAQVQPDDNNGDYWEPDENGNFSASITFLNSIVDASGFDDSGVESFTPQMRKAFQKHRLRKTTPDSTWSSNGYREHLEMRGRYLIVLLNPNATTDLLEDLLTFIPQFPGGQACPVENGECMGTINFFPSPAVRGVSPRTFCGEMDTDVGDLDNIESQNTCMAAAMSLGGDVEFGGTFEDFLTDLDDSTGLESQVGADDNNNSFLHGCFFLSNTFSSDDDRTANQIYWNPSGDDETKEFTVWPICNNSDQMAPLSDRMGSPSDRMGSPSDRMGSPSNRMGRSPSNRMGSPSNRMGSPSNRMGRSPSNRMGRSPNRMGRSPSNRMGRSPSNRMTQPSNRTGRRTSNRMTQPSNRMTQPSNRMGRSPTNRMR